MRRAIVNDTLIQLTPVVRSACARVLGPRHPSLDDAIQESLTKIWRNLGSYRSRRGRLTTYAYAIARRVAIDTARGLRQGRPLQEDHAQPATEPAADAVDLLDAAGLSRRERQMARAMMADPGMTDAALQRATHSPGRLAMLRCRGRLQQKIAKRLHP